MCGICGFVSFAPRPAAELAAVAKSMADTLAHRGPDGEGVWSDDTAGLGFGHRRLAIIDLSPGGAQPMLSASGRFAITYNGEIYNYRELRAELESAGIRFRTQSDTEVLIEACARWGVAAAAKRLNGIFAFALWDREARRLALVRDQLGVKPLYWSRRGGTVTFGSELRALAAHPGWRAEIDRDSLAAFFRHADLPAPRTIYRDVAKLAPGTIVTIDANGAPETSSYWDPLDVALAGLADPLDLPDAEAEARLDALLRAAVGRQMVSDVPLGAFLSGGIDSSAVTAAMQALNSRPVKTFTIGFREDGYDEAAQARAVAKHLGADHTELYVTGDEARALVPGIADWFDEPFADSSQLPTHLVARLARRQVTVALSGDGGDETFAGYNRYAQGNAWYARFAALPGPLRSLSAVAMRALSPAQWDRLFAFLPASAHPRQAGDKLHKLADIVALDGEGAVYRRLISQWDEPERLVPGAREPKGIVWDDVPATDIPDFAARMQYLDTATYLPDDILTKVDRASMAVALEARVPLLDPELVAFAWRLPMAMKLRGGQGKWLLRQVLHRYVPRALVERPKTGFGIPIDAWLRGPLRDWAEDLLDERRIAQEGLLDAALVRAAWREHLSGRRNHQYRLWCVLMFQAWKRRWFDAPAQR